MTNQSIKTFETDPLVQHGVNQPPILNRPKADYTRFFISSFILHPSPSETLREHPSSFILHPSDFTLLTFDF